MIDLSYSKSLLKQKIFRPLKIGWRHYLPLLYDEQWISQAWNSKFVLNSV
jgi:hypothetical protein